MGVSRRETPLHTIKNDLIMPISFEPKSITDKGWGREILIENRSFCAKFLNYDKKGAVSSAHIHYHKSEAFCVIFKSFEFHYWDQDGNEHTKILNQGDFVNIPSCCPHQLIALEDGASIFEASSFDDPNDCVRIRPGDSQNNILAQMIRDNQ